MKPKPIKKPTNKPKQKWPRYFTDTVTGVWVMESHDEGRFYQTNKSNWTVTDLEKFMKRITRAEARKLTGGVL